METTLERICGGQCGKSRSETVLWSFQRTTRAELGDLILASIRVVYDVHCELWESKREKDAASTHRKM